MEPRLASPNPLSATPTTARSRRPVAPHLGVYKWGSHMLVSILHRTTGVGLALVGLPLFAWWLAAAASGEAGYAGFLDLFTTDAGKPNIIGWVFGIGLSLAFFQHLSSGVRHLFMDVGALFELKANRTSATLTMVASTLLTIVFWAVVVGAGR